MGEVPWEELPVGGSNRGGNIREGIVRGGNCPWGEVTGREMSGRELFMGGSAREGKRRGELPGVEVSGHLFIQDQIKIIQPKPFS